MKPLHPSHRFVIPLFFGALFLYSAIPHSAHADSINSYDVTLRLEKTGAVLVRELIDYDFGESPKHGIVRHIPLINKGGPRIKITDPSFTDENGTPYPFTTKTVGNDNEYTVGDPQKTITGVHTYSFDYLVSNVIRHFADHDELYWNAVGTEWNTPISAATVHVELPKEIPPDSVDFYCYGGSTESAENLCHLEKNENIVTLTANRPLSAYEGLTFSASFPAGLIQGLAKRSVGEEVGTFFERHQSAFFAFWFLVLIGYFFLLSSFGKRRGIHISIPKDLKNKSIMAEYAPPNGITPFDAVVLSEQLIDMEDVAPVIIDLAIKGYLKINFIDGNGLAGKDYEFTKLKDGANLEHFAYREIFAFLFTIAGEGTVPYNSIKLSELKKQPKKGAALIDFLQVESSHYFENNGYATWNQSHTKELILIVAGVFLRWALRLFRFDIFIPFLILAVLVLLLVSISQKIKSFKLTAKGEEVLSHLLGFKEFLTLTEGGAYKLLNAPACKPETFEQYLPYAMALGVEKEWAHQFSTIAPPQPSWILVGGSPYYGGSFGYSSSMNFADSLRSFSSDLKSTLTVESPLGSSFMSGGGGSGSSGGGSGGGGGGSW